MTLPPESLIAVASIPVKAAPLPTKLVAVITPAFPKWILFPTLTKSSISAYGETNPVRAVIIPTESILVTSSYAVSYTHLTLPTKRIV